MYPEKDLVSLESFFMHVHLLESCNAGPIFSAAKASLWRALL
jgi:hypothetical protein